MRESIALLRLTAPLLKRLTIHLLKRLDLQQKEKRVLACSRADLEDRKLRPLDKQPENLRRRSSRLHRRLRSKEASDCSCYFIFENKQLREFPLLLKFLEIVRNV